MRRKDLFIRSIPVLFAFAFLVVGTLAQAATITIDILATFDYPGTGNSTLPQKINDAGEIAGYYKDASGVSRGFVRLRNGNFSPPIVDPNWDGFLTSARAINNSGLVAGFYVLANFAHGFFLSGNTYTDFDLPGALNTDIDALNDAGDFGGTADFSTGNQAWVSIGGSVSFFGVPGALTTVVYGLNNSNQAVGQYTDSASVGHGYFRDTDSTLTFPIDPPDSTETFLFRINDRKWMVGRYKDNMGVTHGLFFLSPTRFIAFDYPDSTFTSFNGINRQGLICGRYDDNLGIEHGFLARVRRTP